MNTNYKHYHLINSTELHYFQQYFINNMLSWNEIYFIKKISLDIKSCTAITHFSDMLLLAHNENPLALVDSNYLLLLKRNLFKEISDCFDQVCNEIFMCLLKELFELDQLQFMPNSTNYKDWVYPGSSCLNITFSNKQDAFNLYLHPNWVLSHLPQMKHTVKKIVPLEDALAAKTLGMTVEFEPLRLNLEKLHCLQVGDLIKTDHRLDEPLQIHYQRKLVCEGVVGQLLQHKSLQITRSL